MTDERFERELLRRSKKLRNLLRSLGAHSNDVEDLLCAVFEKAWRARGSIDPERNIDSWLCKIAANVAHDHRRYHARRIRATSLNAPIVGESIDIDGLDVPDPTADVERLAFGNVLSEELQSALKGLPKILRDTFLAVVVDGQTQEEAAARAHITEGTVRSRVHRARRRLTAALS